MRKLRPREIKYLAQDYVKLVSGKSDFKTYLCWLMIPGSGRSPGIRNGNLLQCSCLENSVGRGTWQAIAHGVAKSQTQPSTCTHACMHTCAYAHTHTHTHIHTHTADSQLKVGTAVLCGQTWRYRVGFGQVRKSLHILREEDSLISIKGMCLWIVHQVEPSAENIEKSARDCPHPSHSWISCLWAFPFYRC